MSHANELADKLFEISTKCDHHYSLDRSAADELRRLHARSEEQERLLRDALQVIDNLRALIWGECPSLLNEDSGGCSHLDMQAIDAAAAIRKHLGEQT